MKYFTLTIKQYDNSGFYVWPRLLTEEESQFIDDLFMDIKYSEQEYTLTEMKSGDSTTSIKHS